MEETEDGRARQWAGAQKVRSALEMIPSILLICTLYFLHLGLCESVHIPKYAHSNGIAALLTWKL